MDTLEGNKLIAEFMELDKKEYGSTGITYYIDGVPYQIHGLKYHSSWDWLMPVVDKISRDHGAFRIVIGNVATYSKIDGTIFKAKNNASSSPIDSVYKAVVEFIEWHNRHQPVNKK